jgi:hypothetical protein
VSVRFRWSLRLLTLCPRIDDDSAPEALPNTTSSCNSPSPSPSVVQSQNSTHTGDGGKYHGKGQQPLIHSLLVAAIATPSIVLVGTIIGYVLWRRRVHVRLRAKAGSWFRRCFGSKDHALPPLTSFPTTTSPDCSPSPRSEKSHISIAIEGDDIPFEGSHTSLDLENPPLAPDCSPSPRSEKSHISIVIEGDDIPFEGSHTTLDLENPPLAPVTPDVPRNDEPSAESSARSSATIQTVRQACIQDQIDSMRAQIEWLMSQQQSDWALGLTDEPPPSYRQSDGSRFAVTPIYPEFPWPSRIWEE